MYRTADALRAWTATSPANVEQVKPAYGSYGSYTYFEYDGFLGFSGYALGNEIVPTNNTITLPVELTNFSGNCGSAGATLNWRTASELNSRDFMVQRSADGVHFSSILSVKAAGTSTQPRNYTATDSSATGNENYYRLLEIDNEGNETFHSVILVRCREVNGLQVFANGNAVTVDLQSVSDKTVQFNLIEVSGKVLYSEKRAVSKGDSRIVMTLPVKPAEGIYILQIIDGNSMSSMKLLMR
jgi:hypothetical protein